MLPETWFSKCAPKGDSETLVRQVFQPDSHQLTSDFLSPSLSILSARFLPFRFLPSDFCHSDFCHSDF
jgi:hypothetical protein